jgi:hypothetical protein
MFFMTVQTTSGAPTLIVPPDISPRMVTRRKALS